MNSNSCVWFAAAISLCGMGTAQADVVRTGDAFISTDNGYRILGAGITDGATGGAKITAPGPEVFDAVNIGQGRYGGGVGTMEVSGAGAAMIAKNIVGVGTTGNGTLLINNGGKVVSEGGPSPYCASGCNYTSVANGAGSTGRLTVTGAGSSFENRDVTNSNAGFMVANGGVTGDFGQAGASTYGYMSVLSGAQAKTTWTRLGNLVNTYAYVDIAGAGSAWTVGRSSGNNGMIYVGYGGNAEMMVRDGATVDTQQMYVGHLVGSNGKLSISGEGSRVQLSGTDINGTSGARAVVGVGGSGVVKVSDKAVFGIDTGNLIGGLAVGGTKQQAAASGRLEVSNGAKVLISGTNSSFSVRNNGQVDVSGNSLVDVAATAGSVGRSYIGADAVGKLAQMVVTGSTFNAGKFLGVDHYGNARIMTADTNLYSAMLILQDNSVVQAENIAVGAHGLFGGNGTVIGNVHNIGGTIQVGASPDELVIHGDFEQDGGAIHFEIDPDGAGGYLTSTLVFDKDKSVRMTGAKIFFDAVGGADALEFLKAGLLDIDTFFRTGDGTEFSKAFSVEDIFQDNQFFISGYRITGFDAVTGAFVGLAAVPEPSSLLILLLGGCILLGLRSRRIKQRI